MPETMELEKKSKFENVDTFDAMQYAQHIPDGIRPALMEMFAAQAYGWKARARAVLKIARAKQEVQRLETDLTTLCTAGRSRTRQTPEGTARGSVEAFLATLTPEQLRNLCDRHNVSYAAFKDDPANLYGALIDEMLATV